MSIPLVEAVDEQVYAAFRRLTAIEHLLRAAYIQHLVVQHAAPEVPTRHRSQRRHHHVPLGCPLTRREFELTRDLAGGETYDEVASRTGRKTSTLRSQMNYASERLGTTGALQTITRCLREGWLVIEQGKVAACPEPPEPLVKKDKMTAIGRVYLEAFDLHLQSSVGEEDEMTRGIMSRIFPKIGADPW